MSTDYTDLHWLFFNKGIKKGIVHRFFLIKRLRKKLSTDYTDLHRLFFNKEIKKEIVHRLHRFTQIIF